MPLQDSDNFIIGRGTDSYKITYQDLKDDLNYVPPPTGTINQPTVLEPNDGEGSGDTTYLKSDTITAIEGGGTVSDGTTATSSSILYQWSNWDTTVSGSAQITTNNYPLSENDSNVYFTRFGGFRFTVPVTIPAGSVASIDAGNEDGGGGFIYFHFSDGTSEKAAQSLPNQTSWSAGPYSTCSTVANASDRYLVGIEPALDPHSSATRLTVGMKPLKIDGVFAGAEQPNVQIYGTKLTVAGSTDLADMTGAAWMTDGTVAVDGEFEQTPYTLTTSNIESVGESLYWNQTQDWKVNLTVDGGGNFINGRDRAFNGNMSNNASSQTGGATVRFTCPVAFPAGVKLEAKCNVSGGGSHWISVNGAPEFQVFGADVGADGFHNLPYQPGDEQAFVITFRNNNTGGGTDLTGIRIGGQLLVDNTITGPGPSAGTVLTFADPNPDLQYFEQNDEVQPGVLVVSKNTTNNTMVVDGGDWTGADGSGVGPAPPSGVTWSTNVTGVTTYPNSNLFSEDTELYVSAAGQGLITWTCPESFPPNSKLEVLGWAQDFEATVNGGPTQTFDAGDWTELTYSPGDEQQFVVTMKTKTNGANTKWKAVRVNGQVLVDGKTYDDVPPGDTYVEYQTNGGQGNIVSVNTTDNTIFLTDTGDRNNRWIKSGSENKAGTNFYVAGPSIIDNPLLTNDVDLRCSDFATTPPDADTLKEIVWKINGVEYSANTTNPWKPLANLPTNSTVTVAVKHIGNTLGESAYSGDVTFETGNSIRSLFTRLAALEADEVTDDATDTALLTLIAGLAARIQALEESN